MPAPKKPNTQAARAALAAKREDGRRAAILNMQPQDRAALTQIMHDRQAKITDEINTLHDEAERIVKWLAEFGSEPTVDLD